MAEMRRLPHIALPTLGGRQLWTDVRILGGWRIQRHAWTGHCRLLDRSDTRRAWGTQNHMLRALREALAETPRSYSTRSHGVVLVHGLGRSQHSLEALAQAFAAQGFDVVPFNYASTQGTIEAHARALNRVLEGLGGDRDAVQTLSFVTHSLGALVVRRALALKTPSVPVHRVVMLAPPNQGSHLAETLSKWACARAVLGPVLTQLSPLTVQGIPRLSVPFSIVAGTFAPLSGGAAGQNDGIVSVEETKLAGASVHLTVQASHTFIMNDPNVVAHSVDFISKRSNLRENKK